MLNFVTWTVDPEIINIAGRGIRWYGLLWGLGFLIGLEIMKKQFKMANQNDTWADKLFMYVFLGAIIGARIGHCFFYEWSTYSRDIIRVLYIWEGGLASHGAAIGILVSMYFYNKYVTKMGYIWIFDRISMSAAIGGLLIRLGNLMNHEIYGSVTDLPWGFRFVDNVEQWMRGAEPIFTAPSHPTQIYEMLYCLAAILVTGYLYFIKKAYDKKGLIFGSFLLIIFGSRFFLEFLKLNQEAFEDGMILNMGQILSLPFMIWGAWLVVNALYIQPRKITKSK